MRLYRKILFTVLLGSIASLFIVGWILEWIGEKLSRKKTPKKKP